MKEFKDKNYKLIMGISVTCLVLIIFASSYAYFKTKIINNTNPFSVKVGKVDLLVDTNQITIENAAPILDVEKNEKAVTKTFTIKRTSDSNLDICYNLYLVIDQITDNIKNSKYLKYELTDKKSGEVISKNLSTATYSEGKSTILLKNQYLSDSDTTGVEYELKVWLSYDEVEDQTSLLGGSLTAHLYVSGMQGTACPASVETVKLASRLLANNPTISTRTDFSTRFTTNTANTLYKATENGTDVYYFAGQDTESTPINNWVKFGKYKSDLIKYRGFNARTTTKNFMEYSTMEECTSAPVYNKNCAAYKYASAGDDMYWRIIRTNSDGSIRLLYHGTSTTATDAYIGKSTFNTTKNSPKYVGYMYGDTDTTPEEARTNANDSTIKTYIDNWYANNMTSYTKYLSTTAVYCNDRELASGASYSATGSFYYAAFTRLKTNKTPTYDCTNNNDKFTVDASTGNGKLTYPIALMTADEIAYAGGVNDTNAPMWYYTNSSLESSTGTQFWWSLSPFYWNGVYAFSWDVYGSDSPGALSYSNVLDSRGVRPVVSLKTCTLWTSGNGAPETPYEIIENGEC
ncbi:MAG: hypothetical protein MR779_02170 [Tenericutes bacterium]|nr:hypothetical protein [Mycoplasmatota bacterium]